MTNEARLTGNPLLPGRGVCDPHIRAYHDRAYPYATHDRSPANRDFVMDDWWIWSSADLVDWRHECSLPPEGTYNGKPDTNCWAMNAIERDGEHYLFFSRGPREIGVVEGDSPVGPWRDPFSAYPSKPDVQTNQPKSEKWFWEGNVQSKVISFLANQGYHIRSVADTTSQQQGIDIVAEKEGIPLWVSVKGFPQGTVKTISTVQAGYWFKQAIFDILEYQERDRHAQLAVAFPDYPRYHSMAQKITWIKPVANFSYFWIRESGEVTVE